MRAGRGARLGLLCGLLTAVLLLTGCVSIPDSGPVVPGRDLGQPGAPRVQVYPREPADGAGPVEIVRGFLSAAPDFALDHRVARLYLAEDARATWRPDSPVVIYRDAASLQVEQVDEEGRPSSSTAPSASPSASSALPAAAPSASPSVSAAPSPRATIERGDIPTSRPRDGETATVQVRVPVIARILDGGIYRVSESSDEEIKIYHLTAKDGHWRITDPADGVVISNADFRYTFGSVPLYFPDAQHAWLVPDLRWFPLTSSPTVVVSALLDGPTSWLRQAVTSAVPTGTKLTANGVRVDGATLTVDLSKRAIDARPQDRRVLYAQLVATIAEAAQQFEFRASDVRVTVEQAKYEIPATGAAVPVVADSVPVDARPVVLDDQHRVARLDDDLSSSPVPGLEHLGSAQSTRPAASPDGRLFAVLDDERSRLLVASADQARRVVAEGKGLTSPSFDQQDWVWTSPVDSAGYVLAGLGARTVKVGARWLGGYRVASLRISREGARALVVAAHNGHTSAFVSGVVRTSDGTPSALTVPMQLVPDLAGAVDGSWVDARSVVVLGKRTSSADEQPWLVQIGGDISPTITVQDGESVTAGTVPYELWVQTPKGVLARSGGTFLPVKGVHWPAIPG